MYNPVPKVDQISTFGLCMGEPIQDMELAASNFTSKNEEHSIELRNQPIIFIEGQVSAFFNWSV